MRNLRFIVLAMLVLLPVLFVAIYMGNANANEEDETTERAPAELRGTEVEPPVELEDFALASTTGDDFILSEQEGKVTLLYFGFMNCPDFCPTTMAKLIRVYRDLEPYQDQINIVFVTIDPERDTLDRLTRYVAGYHEDFIGLWGEPADLSNLTLSLGVVAIREEIDSALGYVMNHTTHTFLLDMDGQFRVVYPYGTEYQDIVNDVQFILDEGV